MIKHLIMVQQNNEIKIAQYGQWNGDPVGEGASLLMFCKKRLPELIKVLPKVTFLTDAEHNAFVKDLHNKDYKALIYNHSFINSALSVNVFDSIIESNYSIIKLYNDFAFGYDSLQCEWAYCINLDTNELEIYKGSNKNKLEPSERFYRSTSIYTDEPQPYYGVRLIKTYDLDQLPDEETFVKELTSDVEK